MALYKQKYFLLPLFSVIYTVITTWYKFPNYEISLPLWIRNITTFFLLVSAKDKGILETFPYKETTSKKIPEKFFPLGKSVNKLPRRNFALCSRYKIQLDDKILFTHSCWWRATKGSSVKFWSLFYIWYVCKKYIRPFIEEKYFIFKTMYLAQ